MSGFQAQNDLLSALMQRNTDAMKDAISRGADVKNPFMLQIAVSSLFTDGVKMLIDAGATPSVSACAPSEKGRGLSHFEVLVDVIYELEQNYHKKSANNFNLNNYSSRMGKLHNAANAIGVMLAEAGADPFVLDNPEIKKSMDVETTSVPNVQIAFNSYIGTNGKVEIDSKLKLPVVERILANSRAAYVCEHPENLPKTELAAAEVLRDIFRSHEAEQLQTLISYKGYNSIQKEELIEAALSFGKASLLAQESLRGQFNFNARRENGKSLFVASSIVVHPEQAVALLESGVITLTQEDAKAVKEYASLCSSPEETSAVEKAVDKRLAQQKQQRPKR